MTDDATEPVTDQTVDEIAGSLTGFDEHAIRQTLGFDPYAIAEAQPMSYTRALIFVDQRRREGVNDAAAKRYAMELRVDAINSYFTDDDEADPEDPDTESGKDS